VRRAPRSRPLETNASSSKYAPALGSVKSLTTQHAMAGGEMDILIGSAPSVCGLDRQHIRWIADDLATAHRRHDPVLIDLGCRRTAAERSDWR
jgi:hypothetical protein